MSTETAAILNALIREQAHQWQQHAHVLQYKGETGSVSLLEACVIQSFDLCY